MPVQKWLFQQKSRYLLESTLIPPQMPVPVPFAVESPENVLKIKILGPIPDRLRICKGGAWESVF